MRKQGAQNLGLRQAVARLTDLEARLARAENLAELAAERITRAQAALGQDATKDDGSPLPRRAIITAAGAAVAGGLATTSLIRPKDVFAQVSGNFSDLLVDGAATFTNGPVTLPDASLGFGAENKGVSWRPTAGGPWRMFVQTAANDPQDHVLATTYNWDMVRSQRDVDNEPVIRHGLETDYHGVFEWNLDLGAIAAGGVFFTDRPWLYNYVWADRTSILALKGRMDIYQAKDRGGVRVLPLADNQVSYSVAWTKLDQSVLMGFSPASGMLIRPSGAAVVPINVEGSVGQIANLQNWRDYQTNTLASIRPDGSFRSYTGSIQAVFLKLTKNHRISQGAGLPVSPNGASSAPGDVYFRTDTPVTTNQRIYVCTAGGTAPTWVGIV